MLQHGVTYKEHHKVFQRLTTPGVKLYSHRHQDQILSLDLIVFHFIDHFLHLEIQYGSCIKGTFFQIISIAYVK